MSQTKVAVGMINATGTPGSGNFLRGDGTWNAAGSWNLIGSTTGSGASTLDITGLTSTYKTYCIIGEDLVPGTDATIPWMRLGDSSGVDSGSTDYGWCAHDGYMPTNAEASNQVYDSVDQDNQDAQIEMMGNETGMGTGTREAASFQAWLHRPQSSVGFAHVTGIIAVRGSPAYSLSPRFNGHLNAATTVDRVQFLMSSGTISGTMTVWGIAHA